MNDVTKDLLEALKGLLVRVADDEEYGPDHAVTVARAAIARAEAALAEPQPDADGWIPWAGGECPVDSKAWVEAKLRDGKAWIDEEGQPGEEWLWDHDGGADDIIAYRIVRK